MARGTLAPIASMLASIALLTSCVASDARRGLADVAGLSARIDQVGRASELAGQRVDAAVKALQAIARSDFTGDTSALYTVFVASVEVSEKQAAELRSAIEAMKEDSDELYRSWRENLSSFANEPIRRHSEERQAATRERFEAIVTSAETAQTGCDAVNRTLRDHIAYMRYDFSVGSLAVIQAEIAALAQCAATLTGQCTTCQVAAKTYVEAASFPSPDAAGTAEPEKESPAGG